MTTARLLTAPGEGHGLTDKQTNELYKALVDGKPTAPIVAVVLLEPVGTSQRKTAQGLHRSVTFEATRLEPVHDANQSGELRYLIQALYEQRTSTGQQRSLPLGLGADEEKRHALLERIEDWSNEEGMTGVELEKAWRAHFGIDPDKDFSYGDHGVPGDYHKAGVQQLLEFALHNDLLDRREPEQVVETDPGDPDDEGAAEAADVVGVKCQVCQKPSPRLTDGLCDSCCKNAGLPVASEDATPPKAGKDAAAGKD